MIKRFYTISLFLLMCFPIFAQDIIQRPHRKVEVEFNSGDASNMKHGIYYMCIAWGKNINWVKGVCKTWTTKGYKPNLVTNPNDDLGGYYVCIKQFSDKSSAEKFAKSNIKIIQYIWYNFNLLNYHQKKGVIE